MGGLLAGLPVAVPPPGVPGGKPPAGKFSPAPAIQLAGTLIRLADTEKKGKIGQLTLLNAAAKLFTETDKNQDGISTRRN